MGETGWADAATGGGAIGPIGGIGTGAIEETIGGFDEATAIGAEFAVVGTFADEASGVADLGVLPGKADIAANWAAVSTTGFSFGLATGTAGTISVVLSPSLLDSSEADFTGLSLGAGCVLASAVGVSEPVFAGLADAPAELDATPLDGSSRSATAGCEPALFK
jgi:hypothetical protein